MLTEQADVHLLQGVDAAELVELVVNLVEYQGLVVVGGEVLHYVVNWRRRNEELRRVRAAGVDTAYLQLEPGSSPLLSGQSKS